MREEWNNRKTNIQCHQEIIECGIGTKHLILYSSYGVLTHFLNLEKNYLMCRESDTLQSRYPLSHTVKALCIIT